MTNREQDLERENERLRTIIRETYLMVERMNESDQEPQTRGWASSILGVQMCEVPDLLKSWGGFTAHEGGPGLVGPVSFNTAQ